ncbi:S9 family peptidase [Streptacidiphilus sp. PAMC 29251]
MSTDPAAAPAAHRCWHACADPTGTRAAFICDRGGVPQLWTAALDGTHLTGTHLTGTDLTGSAEGADPRLLDPATDPVTSVSWSPDGRWIAYTAALDGGEHARVLVVRPDGTGRRVLAGADTRAAAYLGCWTRAGSAHGCALAVTEAVADAAGDHGLLAASLVDPEGLRPPLRLATETGAATLRICDLTADGRLALLRRGPRGRREAVVLRLADRVETCVLPVADGDPWIGCFAPDGRTLWLRSDADREFAALLAVGLAADGTPEGSAVAAEQDGADLELLAPDRDGTRAALVWNHDGSSALQLATLQLATLRTDVPLPHEVVTRADADAVGGFLLSLSGSTRLPGVWSLPPGPADADPRRTRWSSRRADAAGPGRPAVRPQRLHLRARDGLPLAGWHYRAPDNWNAPGLPPCVVHLHGGPESQERPVLEPLYQHLLGRGFDVFAPDVRGSSGYGRSFVDADLGDGRFAAIDDVADCAAHLVRAGLADPGRLAVMGRSYGGYLVLASLVRNPAVFRTGIDVCGMSDFATFFAGTEPWIAESAAVKYGHPERDRELLRKLSPLGAVGALRVPLLAVHGAQDTNVPLGESEQFVRAAREHGVRAELLVAPDEGHEFTHRANRELFYRTAADWLEQQLS